MHMVYAVGLQESAFALGKGEKHHGTLNNYLSEVLCEALGPEYKIVQLKQMWEIRLLLIAHDDVRDHIEVLDTATEATGIGGVGGNKGGVGIALTIHRTTMCFVTAHLAAHQVCDLDGTEWSTDGPRRAPSSPAQPLTSPE